LPLGIGGKGKNPKVRRGGKENGKGNGCLAREQRRIKRSKREGREEKKEPPASQEEKREGGRRISTPFFCLCLTGGERARAPAPQRREKKGRSPFTYHPNLRGRRRGGEGKDVPLSGQIRWNRILE